MAHLSKEPTTKEKLATIVQGFDDFDHEMKRGTRVSHFIRCCAKLLLLSHSNRICSSDERKMNLELSS